jgi:acyl-CoA thioester hydrolase
MNKEPQSTYTVRFSDCDPLGHLNNARYLDYFLNAREDHLKEHYSLRLDAYYRQGLIWVIRDHRITYLQSVTYNETIAIQTSLLSYRDNKLVVEMLMTDEHGHKPKAYLWTRFNSLDLKTKAAKTPPPDFIELVEEVKLFEYNEVPDYEERLRHFTNKVTPDKV